MVNLRLGDLCHFAVVPRAFLWLTPVGAHGMILPLADSGRIPGKFGCHLHCTAATQYAHIDDVSRLFCSTEESVV